MRAPRVTGNRVRHTAAMLALAGVGLALGVPFLLGSHDVLAGLSKVHAAVFAVLALTALVSGLAKAGKLQLLQGALGLRLRYTRTAAITFVTDFAFLVSPLGAAGYGANIGLLQREGASWATATTVVSADQALDLMFFGVAIPVGIVFAIRSLTQVIPAVNPVAVYWTLGGLVLAAALAWSVRRPALRALDALSLRVVWLRSRRAQWARFRQHVVEQWKSLLGAPPERVAALLVLTTVQWLLRYGALWFALLELGYRLPVGFVLAVQAVVLHAALWTGVPAGGGGGDLGLAAAFAPWVPRATMGTALVLWRFATLYVPLLLGAIGFAAVATRPRAKHGSSR
ncbi:lysylphosphatidylglycerol synthase transmembrane domain-containing protein [Paraburkholderia phosphatilytica]|uniref:lysylphosphatidylglycerol synthase transmembrane domain-containing protein n=1 Tax=Paraburkholderia phosphatilytica TaxID=2282883 RepID=UPI0013DEB084|nr:lysylphosphatidylglycerol synthase transmembrane domain-containing protein [Paraburkholderia phosphatilytica]